MFLMNPELHLSVSPDVLNVRRRLGFRNIQMQKESRIIERGWDEHNVS